MLSTPCLPRAPVHLMHVHATRDPTVPMHGPLCCNLTVHPDMPGLSTMASAELIAKHGCSCHHQQCTQRLELPGAREGEGVWKPMQCLSFRECADAKKVLLCMLPWKSHAWACGDSPGQKCSAPGGVSFTKQILAFWDMVIPASRGR